MWHKCLCKQSKPKSDCSKMSSLILASNVCHSISLYWSIVNLTLILLNKLCLPHPFLTVNQSDNSMLLSNYKFTNWIENSVDPDQMPSDLDLHCFQRQCLSWFSRTRVNFFKFKYNHCNRKTSSFNLFHINTVQHIILVQRIQQNDKEDNPV